MLDDVVFADWIFFGLSGVALLMLRRQGEAQGAGRFRVPGYPVTVWLFVAAAGYVVIGSVASDPGNALRGVGL